jgi:3-hydroxyisobutyrate dehydrogenase-like beta-hydroxyacid dehydrogenase
MKLGVIGLGVIGQEIIYRLQEHDVYVYDIQKSLVDKCSKKGVTGTKYIADLSDCEVFFICVNGDKQIEAVMLGENGLFEILTDGKIVIDVGTTSPNLEVRFEQLCRQKGACFLDGPVSWREDSLIMMVGGDEKCYLRIKALLEEVSSKCRYMGSIGSGQIVKSLNQMIFSNFTAVWAEAVSYANALNIPQDVMTDFLDFSAPESMYTSDFSRTKGAIDNNVKDLLYAIELAHENNITIPLTSVTHQAFKYLMKIGDGKLSQNSLIKYWKVLNGEKVDHD